MEYHTNNFSYFLLVLISIKNAFGFKIQKYFYCGFLKLKKLVIFMTSVVPPILFGGLGHLRKAERGQMAAERAKMKVSPNTMEKECVHLGSVCPLVIG